MLLRLLVPFVVASFVACLVDAPPTRGVVYPIFGAEWWRTFLVDTLQFKTQGIYYYVALALASIVLLPGVAIACQRRWSAAVLVLVCCLARILVSDSSLVKLDITTKMRLPSFGLWAFSFGFSSRVYIDPLLYRLAGSTAHSVTAVLLLLIGSAVWLSDLPHFYGEQNHSLEIVQSLALVSGVGCFVLLTVGWAPRLMCTHPIVLYLSECSYTIYLFHIFFIDSQYFQVTEPRHIGSLSTEQIPYTAQRFVLGMGGSMGVALLGTAFLGDWSTHLLGARLPFDPCGWRAASNGSTRAPPV